MKYVTCLVSGSNISKSKLNVGCAITISSRVGLRLMNFESNIFFAVYFTGRYHQVSLHLNFGSYRIGGNGQIRSWT